MLNKILQVCFVIIFLFTIILVFGCASRLNESRSDEQGLVSTVKQQINYQIYRQDALYEINAHRGELVKWSGYIVEATDNEIQISSRIELKYRHQLSEYPPIDRNDWKNYNFYDNFIFLLDHPLPRAVHIDDITPTVAVSDFVYVAGEIIDQKTITTKSGTKTIVPVLKGYVISKDNDRNFKQPVWITNQID